MTGFTGGLKDQLAAQIVTLDAQVADLLRENAELRAGYARSREALGIALGKIKAWGSIPTFPKNRYAMLASKIEQVLVETPVASLEAIRVEEREACAKIAEDRMIDGPEQYTLREQGASQTAYDIATAIRARGIEQTLASKESHA